MALAVAKTQRVALVARAEREREDRGGVEDTAKQQDRRRLILFVQSSVSCCILTPVAFAYGMLNFSFGGGLLRIIRVALGDSNFVGQAGTSCLSFP